MAQIVTVAHLADELQTTTSRLTRWLRGQRDHGHPLISGHRAGARWQFTREDADRLTEEFQAKGAAGRVSDSAVQRHAEGVIRELLAKRLEAPLEPKVITLASGSSVHIDAVSPDGKFMAEIFARQGELKAGQQKKVAIDTLKLITVRRERPATEVAIAFADEKASAYATRGGWVAQALRTWAVRVEVVDIPQELRDEILVAQAGQRMVNADEAAEDVAVDE